MLARYMLLSCAYLMWNYGLIPLQVYYILGCTRQRFHAVGSILGCIVYSRCWQDQGYGESNGIACRILIQNEQLEQVDTFPYLGSLITKDGECTTVLRIRLNNGQAITAENMGKSQHINLTKIWLMKALVWHVARTAMKAGHSEINEETRFDALEMKRLRKSGFLTNNPVTDTVKARKLAYYGHTMRKQGSYLEKEIMQGTMPGARRRGRPHTAWMDNINTWTGLSVEESIRMKEDRDKYKKYIHGVANPRIEDG